MSCRLLVFLFLLFSLPSLADTVYVYGKADPSLLAYRDSVLAYETGFSVSKDISLIFRQAYHTHDYDAYFLDAWSGNIKFHQPVDTLLGHSEFLPNKKLPEKQIGERFINDQFSRRINQILSRLDSLKVIPYGKVVGAEMPTIYIYKKPSVVVIYKLLEKCWIKEVWYTTIDRQTRFITDEKGRTRIPYNIVRYYKSNVLKKIEWVSPVDEKIVIKTFGISK